MSDAVELESRGIPTVTIVHKTFQAHAAKQAALRGLSDLPMIVVPDRTPKDTPESLETQARQIVHLVGEALISGRPQAKPLSHPAASSGPMP